MRSIPARLALVRGAGGSYCYCCFLVASGLAVSVRVVVAVIWLVAADGFIRLSQYKHQQLFIKTLVLSAFRELVMPEVSLEPTTER